MTSAQLLEREMLTKQLEEEKKSLEQVTTDLKGNLIVCGHSIFVCIQLGCVMLEFRRAFKDFGTRKINHRRKVTLYICDQDLICNVY